jgi:pimeloyl-ACP methyl ester carboxylesterase/acyl-coenzyme A thioesterase PaaI-like protein
MVDESTTAQQRHPVTFTSADGLALRGDAWGPDDGSPVLLLHGGGQSRHAWKSTATRLAEAGYHVVTMDARGHGDSDWSPNGDYDMHAFAGDLLVVLESFDQPPAVVGASMGGMSALLAQGGAAEQLFRAVVLVDVTPRMDLGGVARIMHFMSAHPDGFETLDEAADAIAAYNPHRRTQGSSAGLERVLVQRADGRWGWRWDPRFVTWRANVDHDPVAFEARMNEMAERLYAAARRITVPTLLVRGAQSDVVSDDSVQEFLAVVPGASFVDIAGAGHMVAGDHNDAFSVAVIDFLAEHVGANPAERALIDARQHAATALRRLGHAMADHRGSEETFAELAVHVEQMVDSLQATPRRDHLAELLTRASNERPPRLHGPVTFSRSSPVGGAENPFGADISYRVDDDELVGETTLRSGFQGPPGRAHGGIVSGLIDETMAALLVARGIPGFTVALQLSYTAAAPLHVPLEFRARVEQDDGGVIRLGCTGSHDGHVFVEATGAFRRIDLRRFASELDPPAPGQ